MGVLSGDQMSHVYSLTSRECDNTNRVIETDKGRGSSPSTGVLRSSRRAAASAGIGNSLTLRSKSIIVAYDGASAVSVQAATSDTHSREKRKPQVPTEREGKRCDTHKCIIHDVQSFSGSKSVDPSVTGNLQSIY